MKKSLTHQTHQTDKNTSWRCQVRDNWGIYGRVILRTVNTQLNYAHLRARRPVKRPLMTPGYRQNSHQ